MQMKNENPRKIVVLLAENPGTLGAEVHNAAYEYLGLGFVYKPLPVANSEIALEEAVAKIRAPNYGGASVTMPFKQKVMRHLDSIDAVAGEIGAVNTIVNNGGFLTGYNTDWMGAIEALREVCDLESRRAMLIGAGGAARAIAYGLKKSMASVVVFNRTPEKAEELAAAFGLGFGGGLEDVVAAGDYDVLINATPIGVVNDAFLREGKVVMDVVVVPLETQLLRQAKAKGCVIVPGYRMHLHQAAYQFELFTGRKAPFDVMEKAEKAAIEALSA